jgi:tetratricopeptide (TPR) repeat protein
MERRLRNPDLERVLNAGLKLLEKGKYIGTDKWPAARAELLPHLGNFAPILVEAGRRQPIARVLQAIEPARRLAFDESRFEQTAFPELAAVLCTRAMDNSKKAVAAALFAAGTGAKTQLEAARDVSVRIGESLGEANALLALGDLALRRNDLEGAKTQLEAARDIYVRIGGSLGEGNALLALGDLALRRNDLEGAKTELEAARDIYVRIGSSLGEANTAFIEALASTREDTVKADAKFGDALKTYQTLNEAWSIAQCSLRLAQIAALRGDSASLPAAAAKVPCV